ncbi:MAG: hypothetical protein DYH06_13310, partial [Acidobacteria bacterium ACB2]|nr:hypothetical protein [Acidobacteria bacterium ACB2]
DTRAAASAPSAPQAAQTIALNFQGPTLSQTGSFPPDTMGAVGPTQFIVFVNGRIRSYNKTTGAADGVLNANPDTFFASVITPVGGSVVLSFTSDPRIRYDRLTGRWFLIIIDVPCTTANCSSIAANRVLFAVSDTSTISPTTVWTFYQFQQDLVPTTGNTGGFLDYPTLGIDANALYIGGNMFSAAGGFAGTSAWVVRKSSILSGGPIVATAFRNLASGGGAGPYTPQGVDNFDPAATEGYFVGVDNSVYSRLVLRRVTDPAGSPSLSGNVNLTVPATSNPLGVPTLSPGGSIDAIDDRLFAAHLRNGRLWTAHNIAVTSAGVGATSGANRRTAVRWYELEGIPTGQTFALTQSGTVYDSVATATSATQFLMPSVMVSGQGHAALGFTSAGTPNRANAATVGRLASDTLGTFQVPATLSAMNYTASATNYNPSDGSNPHRWGDYSYTSVDPLDDMTLWTAQQYCQANNSYALRIAKLLAPAPAGVSPASTVLVTGAGQVVSVTGTGFFDPGPDLASPALPFTHIAAQVFDDGTTTPSANVTVNSLTYTSPTTLSLNVTTTGATAGVHDLRITNPDGQYATGTLVFNAPCSVPSTPTPSNNGPVCAGQTLTLSTPAVAGATYAWTGPNGFTSSSQNPSIAGATTAASGTYEVLVTVSGCTSAAGSTTATVDPDAVAPTVTAPAALTVDQSLCCGTFGGASGTTAPALAAFLAGGSATDLCDPAPTRLTPQVGAVDATNATCFEVGATSVTFRYQDVSGNLGTASASVTVRMFGDLNLDAAVDPADMVVLQSYFNFAATPGVPPFGAPEALADLTHDATVDPADMVQLQSYFNFALACLAP